MYWCIKSDYKGIVYLVAILFISRLTGAGVSCNTPISTDLCCLPVQMVSANSIVQSYNLATGASSKLFVEGVARTKCNRWVKIVTETEVLCVSEDLQLYTSLTGHYISAREVGKGTVFFTPYNHECSCLEVGRKDKIDTVFELLLEHPHTFYIGASKILAQGRCDCA